MEPLRSPDSRIRVGPVPRINKCFRFKHLAVPKDQRAKRERGCPRRNGLGRMPGWSWTRLCQNPPAWLSESGGLEKPLVELSLSPIRWGIQVSQQFPKGEDVRGLLGLQVEIGNADSSLEPRGTDKEPKAWQIKPEGRQALASSVGHNQVYQVSSSLTPCWRREGWLHLAQICAATSK